MIKCLIVLFLVLTCTLANKLPEGLTSCSRSDKAFHDCLGKAIEEALVAFKNGNKMFNVPPIDPYHIVQIDADHAKGNPNFNLRSAFVNLDVLDLSKMHISRVATKFDKKFGLKFEVLIKETTFVGNYTMNGKMVVLPIEGGGRTKILLKNTKGLFDLRGDFYEEKGETYIKVTKFKFHLEPNPATFYFEDIFKTDARLSDTINQFMNDNWELVASAMLPGYEEKLGETFKDITNNIFSRVPMNKIFLE
ncbi:CLUMA_CG009874, isoform A [Clunio marinus]|uniref:CLUMA_CG009874, isoform A n=1 Tax=Clunio marinus TaxID=568069 RepID=A0A1J1IA98_9DIPT|nr:CLUMA_CG009874, isoform A [Clunio marinus]